MPALRKRNNVNVLHKHSTRSVAVAAHGANNQVYHNIAPVGTGSERTFAEEEAVYGSQPEAFVGPVAVQAVPGELSRLM